MEIKDMNYDNVTLKEYMELINWKIQIIVLIFLTGIEICIIKKTKIQSVGKWHGQ